MKDLERMINEELRIKQLKQEILKIKTEYEQRATEYQTKMEKYLVLCKHYEELGEEYHNAEMDERIRFMYQDIQREEKEFKQFSNKCEEKMLTILSEIENYKL